MITKEKALGKSKRRWREVHEKGGGELEGFKEGQAQYSRREPVIQNEKE